MSFVYVAKWWYYRTAVCLLRQDQLKFVCSSFKQYLNIKLQYSRNSKAHHTSIPEVGCLFYAYSRWRCRAGCCEVNIPQRGDRHVALIIYRLIWAKFRGFSLSFVHSLYKITGAKRSEFGWGEFWMDWARKTVINCKYGCWKFPGRSHHCSTASCWERKS